MQYFSNISEKGVEMDSQMDFLVEKGHYAVFSEYHCEAWKDLKSNLEVEAAKKLPKARIEMASGIKGGS